MDTDSAAFMAGGSGEGSTDEEEDYYGDLYDRAAARNGSGGAQGVEEVFLDADSRGLLGMLMRVPFKPKLLEVLKQGAQWGLGAGLGLTTKGEYRAISTGALLGWRKRASGHGVHEQLT